MAHLTAKFIIEILGRPADHLKTTLIELVDKIGKDKGVTIIKKEIHDPKQVEKVDNLWTTFADLDLRFDTIPLFFNTIMTYLPAHVEVYDPDSFKLNTFEINELANFVVGKLHNYDALAKKMMAESEILVNKLEFIRKGGDLNKVFNKSEPKKETLKIENVPEKKKKKK